MSNKNLFVVFLFSKNNRYIGEFKGSSIKAILQDAMKRHGEQKAASIIAEVYSGLQQLHIDGDKLSDGYKMHVGPASEVSL